jgi:hypothetical protein
MLRSRQCLLVDVLLSQFPQSPRARLKFKFDPVDYGLKNGTLGLETVSSVSTLICLGLIGAV